MWLGTSSIKGLFSPDTVTHLSTIVGGLSHSGGGSGSASSYSYSYTRQGPQIVHLASSCYYTHTTHTTRRTHRLCTSRILHLAVLMLLFISQILHLTVLILLCLCPHTMIYLPSPTSASAATQVSLYYNYVYVLNI